VRLGAEAEVRHPPRFTGVLGAVGGFLAAAGVVALMAELPDDNRRLSSAAVALLMIVGGYLLLHAVPAPAGRAAGVVVVASAIPPLAFFVAVDPDSTFGSGQMKTALFLTAGGWLLAYLMGTVRGHVLLLGLALVGSWLFVLSLEGGEPFLTPLAPFSASVGPDYDDDELPEAIVTPTPLTTDLPFGVAPNTGERFDPGVDPFGQDDPFGIEEDPFEPPFPSEAETLVEEPDVRFGGGVGSGTGGLSLLVGVAYLAAALVLDRRRLAAAATAFVAAGNLALVSGIVAVAFDEGVVVTALLGLALAVGLMGLGVTTGRRFTAWLGGIGLAVAVSALVGDTVGEDEVAAALLVLMAGAATVLIAYLLGPIVGDEERPPAPTLGETG
jgi:hypothetical protein